MSREETIRQIERLLREHKDGLRGSPHQEPYKGDFFSIFASAFNSGLLDSSSLGVDALADVLLARAPDLLKHESWEAFRTFWSEWRYAWNHAHQLE